MANGSHQLTAVARDAAGNATTSSAVNVTVDNRPPDVTGLVAAYGFEEPSGTAVSDESGTGNVGTISGATRSAAGRFGSALSFDGVNDWVTVPDAASLDLTTGMTLEAWLRPSALNGWQSAAVKEQTGGLTYGLYSNTNNSRPSANVFTNTEHDVRGTAALGVNTWTHVAAVYDASALRIYVNGTQAASLPLSGAMVTSTGALRIGGNQPHGEWFAGLIDELRLYNRALTVTEIQRDMTTAVRPTVTDGQPPTAPSGLTANGGLGQAQLNWTAASDNIGVARYNVHRGAERRLHALGRQPDRAAHAGRATSTPARPRAPTSTA